MLSADRSVQVENRTQTNEPNENRVQATQIPSNTSVQGEITENDVDWYVFDVEPGQRATANLSKPTGRSRLEIALYTVAGQVDSRSVATDETNTYVGDTATASTSYYVRVRGGSNDIRSPYGLNISTSQTDSFEPNEIRATAPELNTTTNTSGTITEYDTDWFRFTAETGQRAVVNLSKPTGRSQLDLALFTLDSQRDSVSIGQDETHGFVADTAESSLTYYVRVESSSARGVSPYTVNRSTNLTDSFEPNENRVSAVSLPVGQRRSGEITENDEDWFTFGATTGERVAVNLAKPSGRSQLEIQLFTLDSEVDSVLIDQDETRGYVADTADTNTTYFVRVVGGSSRARSTYTLNAQRRPTDTFEPNERALTAVPVQPNADLTGEITEHDVDWFAFTADPGNRVVVNLTKPSGESGIDLLLRTPDGRVDSASVATDDTKGRVADTADGSTTYYVRVKGGTGRNTSPYQLAVRTNTTDT